MFVDASAIVAILAKEAEAEEFAMKIAAARQVFLSPLGQYEAALGVARLLNIAADTAEVKIADVMAFGGARYVEITRRIGREAVLAHELFGKGRHRARLNMGDCFSYACAKVLRVPLLCKGDDFCHTDIKIA